MDLRALVFNVLSFDGGHGILSYFFLFGRIFCEGSKFAIFGGGSKNLFLFNFANFFFFNDPLTKPLKDFFTVKDSWLGVPDFLLSSGVLKLFNF